MEWAYDERMMRLARFLDGRLNEFQIAFQQTEMHDGGKVKIRIDEHTTLFEYLDGG